MTLRVDYKLCNAPISGMPYLQYLGLDPWGIRGELTCPKGRSPHLWGKIPHRISLHIPYKYPISPSFAQCVTGIYGYLWNFPKTL